MTTNADWPCSRPGDSTDAYGEGGRHNQWCDSVKRGPVSDAAAEIIGHAIAGQLRLIEGESGAWDIVQGILAEDGYTIAPSEPSSGYDRRHLQAAIRAKLGGGA